MPKSNSPGHVNETMVRAVQDRHAAGATLEDLVLYLNRSHVPPVGRWDTARVQALLDAPHLMYLYDR
jgi:hypothetical protein